MTYVIKTAEGWKPWLPLCQPCPNSNQLEGVYRPEPIEKVQASLNERMKRWAAAMQYNDSRIRMFSGDNFNEPLHGGFGEKL